MRTILGILVVASIGCSSNPGGGSGDPCAMHVYYSCSGADGETCDEVYNASGEAELRPICEDLHDFSGTSRCSASQQCCFHSVGGYGDGPQMHCVSSSVDPDYRGYCVSHGGTYCER